jgi:hypothetical protein
MLAAIYVPFLQVALRTAPLTLWDWIEVFAVASTVFIAVEIAKLVASLRIFHHRLREMPGAGQEPVREG